MAYKLRRGQQALYFYRKLWGEVRLKEMLRQFQNKLIRQMKGRKKLFLLNGVLILFDWNKNRIQESYMRQHYMDLEYIEYLTLLTLTCDVCHKRLVVDNPVPEIVYCKCPGSKPVYNKKFGTCPWTPFIERKDLLVWRRELEELPGLYEYKMYGTYKEIRPDSFLQVQLDTEYRKKWDATAVEIRIIDKDPLSNSDILYWEMQWPRFFANRDYVFNRRYIIDTAEQVIVISNKVTEHPRAPEKPKKIRVKDYECNMVIRPTGKGFDEPGVKFCVTYYDDPGISIPGPVQTWVATSAMPDFLTRLREASKKYPSLRGKMDRRLKQKTDIYPSAFSLCRYFQSASYPDTFKWLPFSLE
ncbi:UNVERIFIED_CONTAM: hypothetical protein PYX00_000946 [Menopon gallinae]|uniref:Phosphatidylcholine transfer protein n=1 Tax=Menopon gallinae TaxID=328185 RepID=A0AAW2IB35_9NEOP